MHSSSTNDDGDDDCQLPCHIVRPEVLREDDGVPLLLSAGREEDLRCITHGRHRRGGGGGYRESLAIYLPEAFVRSNSRALARGELNVCIEGGHVEHGRIVIPGDSADLVRRIRGDDDDSSSWNNRRRLQNDKLRFGTKRLLAVRVSSSFGEVPLESGESVRGALFGTGRNPDNITDAGTVAAQYAAVTHDQLLYVPATGSNITDGVLEIKVNMLFLGNDIQNMTAAIVAQAEEAVGTLANVADNLVFCLPTGSRFGDQASWTAFTYLLEPVRCV